MASSDSAPVTEAMAPEQVPAPRVYVFFDYGCAYSCVGHRRAQLLDDRLDLSWVWVPWEMYPSIPEEGEPIEGVEEPGEHPVEELVGELADEVGESLYWPPRAPNTERALRGAIVLRREAPEAFPAYHEAVFRAVWKQGRNVGDPEVLADIVEDAGLDGDRFRKALEDPAIDEALQAAEDAVDRLGLTRRPTFVFGDQRIVGTDAFEPSLAKPLEAFVDRWQRYGAESTATLEEDLGLGELRTS